MLGRVRRPSCGTCEEESLQESFKTSILRINVNNLVYIKLYPEMVDARVKAQAQWRAKFSKLQTGKGIVSLTSETNAGLRLEKGGGAIFCTLAPSCSLLSRLMAHHWSHGKLSAFQRQDTSFVTRFYNYSRFL